jgi:translation initiation factor 5A
VAKPGTPGHDRISIVAVDLFNGEKYEDMVPSTHTADVPHIRSAEFRLSAIDGGYLTLTDAAGDTREHLRLPAGELGEKIRRQFGSGQNLLVTVLSALGEEQAVSVRDATAPQ